MSVSGFSLFGLTLWVAELPEAKCPMRCTHLSMHSILFCSLHPVSKGRIANGLLQELCVLRSENPESRLVSVTVQLGSLGAEAAQCLAMQVKILRLLQHENVMPVRATLIDAAHAFVGVVFSRPHHAFIDLLSAAPSVEMQALLDIIAGVAAAVEFLIFRRIHACVELEDVFATVTYQAKLLFPGPASALAHAEYSESLRAFGKLLDASGEFSAQIRAHEGVRMIAKSCNGGGLDNVKDLAMETRQVRS